MNGDFMTVERFDPADIPDSLRRFWADARLSQDPVSRFIGGPEWFEMMAAKTEGAFVAAVRDDIAGWRVALPLLPRDVSLEGALLGKCLVRKTVPGLKVCGGDITGDVSLPALRALWKEILVQCPTVRAVTFDHLEDSGSRLEMLQASVRTAREPRLFAQPQFHAMPHYRLKLPEDAGACEHLRSKKSMQRLREKERALMRRVNGDLCVVEIRSEADWAPYAGVIDRLMNETWQARLLGHRFELEDQREIAERGWLRSFLLLAGGQAVAFDLCYQAFGVLVYDHVGFDQAYSSFSPGAILLHRLLPMLYERDRPTYVDFGEGEAEYKRRAANEMIGIRSVHILRAGVETRTVCLATGIVRVLDRQARGAVKRFAAGRRLIQRMKRGG
jgi:hypothetical protein